MSATTIRRLQSRFVPAGTGETTTLPGTRHVHKVGGADTGGAYSVWEGEVEPGAGPPPHVHHLEDEGFYILEGEFEFYGPGVAPLKAGPGDYVHTPKGTQHTFKNTGTTVGRMLCLATPGGIERFFAAVSLPAGAPAPAGPPSPAQVAHLTSVARDHGIEIVLPN